MVMMYLISTLIKDITKIRLEFVLSFYPMEEGMDVKIAEVPIEVAISGKVQDKDLEFTIGIDDESVYLSCIPMYFAGKMHF